ncbi:glutathione S-transferase family protein [Rivibacter subsaxonicus]|uniref:Glutathione S-transferase n=1 Tax=Rivibacter subsaxonicus TaxID=457575 RepID=A0A4Q7VVN0_9BURK|nr:glutathione S-transferase [Rivibacter subsaxonicus]RZU00643.1 glutathione S-transferase [Rivibacter subsaxonicus]
MTITLCGFPLSNYHNKSKLALLEKGVPFEERIVKTGKGVDAAMLAASPLGKVPYLLTPDGPIAESQVINEWIEATYPEPPLLPKDAFAAAKVRELCLFLDVHLELVVRQLYGQAFFGGTLPEKYIERVREQLEKNIPAVKQLLKFAPYAGGDSFTLADCCAYVHLPVAAMATKIIYGEDLLAKHGIDWKPYVKFIEQRPTAQKVAADRKADQERAALIAGG